MSLPRQKGKIRRNLARWRGERSKYTPKDGTYKPAWKLDPNRILGSGPPKDWRS